MNAQQEPYFEYPFGAEYCEYEYEILKDRYRQYFYDRSRFNREALERSTYLIVGRRGSGKTSLARYFEFQDEMPNAHCIIISVDHIYETLNRHLENHAYLNPDLEVTDVSRVWELLFWLSIFAEYYEQDAVLADTLYNVIGISEPCTDAERLFDFIADNYLGRQGESRSELRQVLENRVFEQAREAVLQITTQVPVIIAVDTFERYDRESNIMMAITAALIHCANQFNIKYSQQGVHVKAFIAAEIFPYIREEKIPNTTKFIRNPVYMSWRPKDLIRLITWRFKKSLAFEGHTIGTMHIDWEDFDEVRHRMWTPFFGETTKNLNGREEQCLTYILRHTQMRPRQLVVMCNAIAREARRQGCYPKLKDVPICDVIAANEKALADEVLNSYHRVYQNVSDIVSALSGGPAVFRGNFIDQVGKKTARFWPNNSYTASNFRKLVAELGIVGRVRQKSENAGIIEADFEYSMDDRLVFFDDDECVIHPMFYTKLNITRDPKYIVYPFPDHSDYKILQAD